MGFWSELRRRHVVRVGGAYVIVAWLLVQIAVALEGAMGLPAWFDGLIVALLILGFPVALLITWAFELTPDGIKPSAPADAGAPALPVSIVDAALAAALLAVLGVSAVQLVRPAGVAPVQTAASDGVGDPNGAAATPASPAAAGASIAVLPFADLSPEGDQEYFSDGLSEELMNQLAHIEDLRVAGRTSSFAYKNATASFQEIGDALGVATVLEGSVRTDGDRLRITAQLINAADGYHLWSETYDRNLDDIFAVQEEIAVAVAGALSIALGVGAAELDYGGTHSFEAYDAFLRARALYGSAPERSVELLNEAVALDPAYARAWAELTTAHGRLAQLAGAPEAVAEQLAEMDRASSRAVEVAPDLWDGHAARASYATARNDWTAAARALARAQELAPASDVELLDTLSGFDMQVGRMRRALAAREEIYRLDPAQGGGLEAFFWPYLTLGRYEEAGEALQRRLDRGGPGVVFSFSNALWLRLAEGDDERRDRWVAWFENADLRPYTDLTGTWDDAERARDILARYADEAGPFARYQLSDMALLAGQFGDADLAVRLLREAYLGPGWLGYHNVWFPHLAEARRTEAFKDFVRDVGFVDLWRESGDWGDFCRPLDSEGGGEDDFECF